AWPSCLPPARSLPIASDAQFDVAVNLADAVSCDRQAMHLEERKLVPVATLKGDAFVAHGEEPTATKAQRIAPFQRDDIASLVNRFHDASHVSSGKLPLEHRPDRVAPFDWLLRHLMVDGICMIEIGQAGGVAGVEPLDPAFDDVTR